jgi:predicted nucleic acid-binding protein
VLEPSPLFVDTWGWLVLEDGKDPAHLAAVELRRRHTDAGGLLVTSDYVLDEMTTRLFSRRPFAEARTFCSRVFEAQSVGMLAVEQITGRAF